MFENKKILITSIGSMSAEAVMRALKKKNYFLVGCNMYPFEWISSSSLVQRFYQVPPAIDENNYIEAVKEICLQEQINFILPLTDTEVDLFSKYEEEFRKRSITVCIPSKTTVQLCRDKLAVFEFFKNDNLVKVIPTYKTVHANTFRFEFPVIIKPRKGRSSEGKQIVYSKEEFNCIIVFKKDYIVQPFFSGYVYVVDLVRNDRTGKICTVQRKELLRTSNGAGMSVEVLFDEDLDEKARYIAKKLKINGCINIEFIHHNGDFYLMDINPRFSAGTAFSLMAGYDIVNNHLLCFEDDEIDDQLDYKRMIVTRKYVEITTENH